MQLNNRWNYTPYRPADCGDLDIPYICRLAPSPTGIKLEWLDHTDSGEHTIVCRERQGKQEFTVTTKEHTVKIENLKERCEYQLTVQNAQGLISRRRLFRTGGAPGSVINYLHPDDREYAFSGNYLCSPGIVRLPGGALLASMDVFQIGKAQNLTLLFRSDDNGASWRYVTELLPCFWGKPFIHNHQLYLLAISTEYGDLLIGRSADEGKTWSTPTVLARGTCVAGRGFHRAPCVILHSAGRLWTSLEYGSWKQGGYANAVLSADEHADLCNPESWHISQFRPREGTVSAIEGNVVEGPDGSIINMLRYAEGQALLLKADAHQPDKMLQLYKIVSFPMAHTKFEVVRHQSGVYYAVGNRAPGRNVLSLYRSADLETWTWVKDILDYRSYDAGCTAFQYPAFLLEGDELLIVSRTAINGAATFHDNNYSTFHRTTIFA